MNIENTPKGSAEWLAEQEGADTTPTPQDGTQATTPEPAPKGSLEWSEQNSGSNEPAPTPTAPVAPVTPTVDDTAPTESKGTPQTETATAPTESKEVPKTDTAQAADNPAGVSAQNNADAVMPIDKQLALLQAEADRRKPETEEERKKRERKERSKKIMAAVGDGLMALSNLYFTTKGAPNMYDHKTMSQQTALQKRLDDAKKEREADADKYFQYSLKIADLQNGKAKTLREMEAQQEARKLAKEKAEREKEEHQWAADLQPSKKKEQEEKANKAKAEADAATAYYQGRVKEVESRTNKNNRQGTSSWVGSRGSGSGSRGSAKWAVYGPDGTVVKRVQTKDEAVSETARIGGKYPETVSKTTGTNEYGLQISTETKRTPTADRPAPKQPQAKQPSYKNTKALGL